MNWRQYWKLIVGGGGVTVLVVLFREVLVNAFGSWLLSLADYSWKYITTEQKVVPWPFALLLAILITTTIASRFSLHRLREAKRRGAQTADLNTKMLTGIVRDVVDQKVGSTKDLVTRFLDESLETFPRNVYRGSLWRPDLQDPDVLRLTVGPLHLPKSFEERKFYIGTDKSRDRDRGVHGTTYTDGEMRIARFVERNGKIELDVSVIIFNVSEGTWSVKQESNTNYPFVPLNDRARAYQSFVSIPINVAGTSTRWGVLAFDGRTTSTFESPSDYEELFALSTMLSNIVYIHDVMGKAASNSI